MNDKFSPRMLWLSRGDIAHLLGVSLPTVTRLLDVGELSGYRIGSQWKVTPRDFVIYLEQARGTSRNEIHELESAIDARGGLEGHAYAVVKMAERAQAAGKAELAQSLVDQLVPFVWLGQEVTAKQKARALELMETGNLAEFSINQAMQGY